jgi:hypothetical protein
MSSRRSLLAAIASTALLLASVARADDDAGVHERTTAAREAFAPPAAERGFSFSFVVLLRGARMGTGRFTAVPGTLAGKPAWKVAERVSSTAAGSSYQAEGWLAPDLRVLRWTSVEEGPVGRKIGLERGKDGLVRTVRGADGEAKAPVEEDGTATAGFVGVLLFVRLVAPSTETYGFLVADGPEAEVVVLQDTGEGRLEEGTVSVAARVTKAMRASKMHEVFRGSISGDLLAIRFADQGLAFVRDDLFGPKKKIDFSRPATTARAAAGRFFLGLLAADRKLIDASVHWPTFFAPIRKVAESRGKVWDEAAARKTFLDKIVEAGEELRSSKPLPAREQLEGILEGGLEKASEVRRDDGSTVVTIQDPLPKPMSVPVRQVGAAWFVVGFPGR